MSKAFFVGGIGTDVGKTVFSAVLVEALRADYWKPLQSGDLHNSDSKKLEAWTSFSPRIHPETYRLHTPISPHASAELEGLRIELEQFRLPATENTLVVEGAGGLLVPLNEQQTILDLIVHLKLPVLLVSRHYLGSINHTLLSLEALHRRGIPLAGLVFNGDPHPSTEKAIESISGVRALCRLPVLEFIDRQQVGETAEQLRQDLLPLLSN